MSPGSFILSEGIYWVRGVDHGTVDPEMEASARPQGAQVRPGVGTVVISRLRWSQPWEFTIGYFTGLLPTSSQRLLTSGFLCSRNAFLFCVTRVGC